MVKRGARVFRWKRMLKSGGFATITELAERERLTLSFVTRILRLTLLAPHVVEAILDGARVDAHTGETDGSSPVEMGAAVLGGALVTTAVQRAFDCRHNCNSSLRDS
jgi:hypothetical protein